ncbi:MAG: hypothetical protein K0U12_03825 [Gammaproteobacteria bacterium]|nr:hypothetical protein [Gammaproteobacteria bacterium]
MKKLVIALIVFLVAIGLGFLIQKDPGDITITYYHWQIETSLWIGALSVIVFFMIIYYLIKFCKHTLKLGEKWQQRRQENLAKKSRHLTHQGLCSLAEGRWKQAENHLAKGAKINSIPLINYLAAARAAQEQGALEKRDDYLRQAHETNPQAEIAIVLTQAQLQIDNHQWEQALATLKHLNELSPNHHHALRLLTQVHLELKDWHQLHNLLPSLRKHRLHRDKKLDALQEDIYLAWLKRAIDANDIQAVQQVWEDVPKTWRLLPNIAKTYSSYLIQSGQHDTAANLLTQALKKHWDPNLIYNYGLAQCNDPGRQLNYAQHWLKKNPNDAHLLLALGQLSMRADLLGQAGEYLNASLNITKTPLTLKLLGELHERLNQPEQARNCYHQALELFA